MKTYVLREPRHRDNLIAFIDANWAAMAKTKHPMVVECKPESTKRSLQQNKRYWAIMRQIADDAWVEGRRYSIECWHEAARRRFLGILDVPGGGTMAQSTTTLSTTEFMSYCDQVEAWAASELGVTILEAS